MWIGGTQAIPLPYYPQYPYNGQTGISNPPYTWTSSGVNGLTVGGNTGTLNGGSNNVAISSSNMAAITNDSQAMYTNAATLGLKQK